MVATIITLVAMSNQNLVSCVETQLWFDLATILFTMYTDTLLYSYHKITLNDKYIDMSLHISEHQQAEFDTA